jgi:hypothetical protein
MDANDLEPQPDGIAPGGVEADASRPSLLRSSWRGAKTGFRLTSYVAGPIAGVSLILGLVVVGLGLETIREPVERPLHKGLVTE